MKLKYLILCFSLLAGSAFAADTLVGEQPSLPGKKKLTNIRVVDDVILNTNCINSSAIVGWRPPNSLSTALYTPFTGAGANTWSTILSLASTTTNGIVMIEAQVVTATASGGYSYARIIDGSNNVLAGGTVSDSLDAGSSTVPFKIHLSAIDTLTTATKTYSLQVASTGASRVWSTNDTTLSTVGVNNQHIKIIQFPTY